MLSYQYNAYALSTQHFYPLHTIKVFMVAFKFCVTAVHLRCELLYNACYRGLVGTILLLDIGYSKQLYSNVLSIKFTL